MKTERKMEQRINIDYIAHEAIVARMERTINKLWIIILVLAAVLVISNAAWIWYESQFEEMTITQEAEAETGNAIVNNGGDVIYGEDTAND